MQFYSALESSRGDIFSGAIISDFLYGQEDGESLHSALDEVVLFTRLATWSETEWVDLLRK